MCGITGFTWEDKTLIRRMTDIVSYRGPDDSGYHVDKGISLGHRRLSIIDLSSAGHQPMSDKEGSVVIVFNGEIYNHADLRAELESKYDFRSATDTEVLIYGYKEWGPEGLLKRLNGMFAFAVWDSDKKLVFLARDRLGIKPLYYSEVHDGVHDGLVFASEIKSILEMDKTVVGDDKKRAIDMDSVASYLTYRFITSDSTVIKGIKKLLPGHYAIYDTGRSVGSLRIRKYWDIQFRPGRHDESYYLKKFKSLLSECVERRLMSDVPLGAFLSGGLDSSLIVAANAALRDDPVKTFTVGFGHETDEFKHARVVADHLGTDHHELFLDYKDMSRELPRIIWFMDEPNSDITMVPLYFLSGFSRKKVTVVNTGEGADELFSGYPHFRVGSPRFRAVPGFIRKNVYNLYYSPFKSWERRTLFWKDVAEDQSLRNYLDGKIPSDPPKDLLDRILLFDIKNELPNWQLQRVDRMTMAHSQEARVPFLDHKMVEFSATVPVGLKLRSLDGKYLIKRAVRDMLPKDIIDRPKQGFTTPRDEWINRDLKSRVYDLLSEKSVRRRGVFDYKYIERLKKRFDSSGKDKPFRPYSYKLMMLMMLEMWFRLYIDGRKPEDIGF